MEALSSLFSALNLIRIPYKLRIYILQNVHLYNFVNRKSLIHNVRCLRASILSHWGQRGTFRNIIFFTSYNLRDIICSYEVDGR